MDMHTLPMRMERALAPQRQAALGGQTRALHSGSYGAMAARWIPDPKVGGSNPSSFTHIFLFFFLPPCNKKKEKGTAETGNRTQAAAATTRSPATRLFRRSAAYGGSGYRSRFSTLRRLYATMYNNPPNQLRPSGLEPESYPWKG